MYDSYPQYDVPQNNVIQRFFTQRWSAIVIEILMTIVITVAAGRAFDIFDPFDAPADSASAILWEEPLPLSAHSVDGIVLGAYKQKAIEYAENGNYNGALSMLDLLVRAAPKDAGPGWYLEIAQFYDTLGESLKASLNYERYFELVGKNAELVAQSSASAYQGAD